MKIGVLTYHYAYNFGANLQVLSTVNRLKMTGHAPVVINWRPEDVEARYRRDTPAAQAAVHEKYICDHLPVSALCRTSDDIAGVIDRDGIDAVIIVSDAVLSLCPQTYFSIRRFRRVYNPNRSSAQIVPNPFWGTFLERTRKPTPCLMMSVSSQDANYRRMSRQERRQAADCLDKMCHVTVRDSWTMEMVSWITKGSRIPEITPDPVFAFNQNVPPGLTDESVIQRFNLPKKYILVSFKKSPAIVTKWVNDFSGLAEALGYACVAFPYPQELNDFSLKHKVNLPLSPLEWYAIIKHAAGYVGHNMHPIVTCIHNGVPFHSFDNYGSVGRFFKNTKSSKIYDLLKQTALLEYTSSVIGRSPTLKSPRDVLNSLVNFDKTKCRAASAMMSGRYAEMMEKIENTLGAFKL